MLQDYLSGGRLPTFLYPSAVDNFKRQFIHLEGGGTHGQRRMNGLGLSRVVVESVLPVSCPAEASRPPCQLALLGTGR